MNSLKNKSIDETPELKGDDEKSKRLRRKDSDEIDGKSRRQSRAESIDKNEKTSRRPSKLDSVSDEVDNLKSKRGLVDDKGGTETVQILC